MKNNDFTQMKSSDIKELKDKAKVLRSEIDKLTMDKNMKKLKDLKQVSKKKKDLARVLTVLRQKEMLAELEAMIESKRKEPGFAGTDESKQSKIKKQKVKKGDK